MTATIYRLDDPTQGGDPDWIRASAETFAVEFANPWHDEIGRFAPKGTGRKSTGAGGGGIGPAHTGPVTVEMWRGMIDEIYVPRRLEAIEAAESWDEENPTTGWHQAPSEIRTPVQYVRESQDVERIGAVADEHKDWWAADHGDQRRLNKWAKDSAARQVSYDDGDAASRAVVNEALDVLDQNPAIAQAVALYGPVAYVRTVGGRNMGSAGGSYEMGGIVVRDYLTRTEPVSGELRSGEFSVDRSVTGVLRHEYGHHVEGAASDHPAFDRFNSAFSEWQANGGTGGIDTVERLRQVQALGSEGLSDYGRKNQGEAFAETFAKVTHPSYDPQQERPGPVKDMSDAMLDILDPEYVT